MATYSIKDLEKISGIKAHTIRIWERRYKLISPKRTATNIRYYCDEDLKRLLNVSILSQNGIKISKIALLDSSQLKDRVIDLCVDVRSPSVQVEGLIVAMLELDEFKFNSVLTNSVIKVGFEATVELVLFPFLERIGLLWQAGSINPAQEHFITHLIRQKLIVAIDREMAVYRKTKQRILFFLPEHEYHDIGLLFYSLVARKENLDVVYLGPSVPIADLKQILLIKPVDYVFTAFVSAIKADSLQENLSQLQKIVDDEVVVFVNGLQIKELHSELSPSFRVITSALDFKQQVTPTTGADA